MIIRYRSLSAGKKTIISTVSEILKECYYMVGQLTFKQAYSRYFTIQKNQREYRHMEAKQAICCHKLSVDLEKPFLDRGADTCACSKC